jgi:hypothetical protein
MPFAWTAIYVMNIINGVNSLERDSGSDKESTGSNSLGELVCVMSSSCSIIVTCFRTMAIFVLFL